MNNNERMLKLLKSFYTLTGIKVVIINPEFKEILAYPKNNSAFCEKVRKKTPHFATSVQPIFAKRLKT